MGTDAMKGMLGIAAMAALALFVFSTWGARFARAGTLWGCSYLGFLLWLGRAQHLIREASHG